MVLRPTVAEISLKNLAHNFKVIKKNLRESSFLCPMIKANAYGHGDVQAAKTLRSSGAERLGVCLVEEGVKLREAGIKCEILTFDMFDQRGAKAIVEHNLTPVLSSWEQILALKKTRSVRKKKVHLKFNTGMNRLGFSVKEALKVSEFLKSHSQFQLAGVCTHLSTSEDLGSNNSVTITQLERLEDLQQIFSEPEIFFHALNSSAIFGNKHISQKHFGARPGLSLYGVIPDTYIQAKPPLKPVMTVRTNVACVRSITPGEKVSYGGRWTSTRNSVMAVVPIGYEDGYFRTFSNNAFMLVRGERCPVIGTVCMDYTMIDITSVHAKKPVLFGEPVVVLGRQGDNEISASQLAQWSNTIPYEVLTSVGARVPRSYLK